MDEEKIKKIEEEGKRLIDEFSASLDVIEKRVREEDITWYVSDINTVTRRDKEGVKKNFKECLKANAPKFENGYVKVD